MITTRQIKETLNRFTSSIKDEDTVLFDIGYAGEVTKRELIASIIIIALMTILGCSISEVISNHVEEKKKIYNQALQIDSKDMLEYGMATNVGNAFVYGELEAVDPVTYDEIGGAYLWIEKTREEYTRHEREVRHEDSKGNVYYTTEEYWTWDTVWTDSLHSEKITFLGLEFNYNQINLYHQEHITTIYMSSHVRYLYYGRDIKHTGTIFANLKDGNIGDNNEFYENKSIQQVLESKCEDYSQILFWVFWIILSGIVVVGFCYLDNSWLS